MRMPDAIPDGMLAPCGINCMSCYRHLRAKNACPGCLMGDEGKAGHCLACAIKKCAAEKGHAHCFLCAAFPCARVKRLDKSYQEKYGVSLVVNGRAAGRDGVAAFLAADRVRWLCPACGGVVSQHDGVCGACGREVAAP